MEGVLDDAADHLRRETSVGEFRDEGCGEGVEVDALVGFEATRGDNFLDVRVVRFCGEGGANMFGETPSSSSRCNASRSARLAALCTALAGMILHARCSRERVPRRPGRERYVKCCA